MNLRFLCESGLFTIISLDVIRTILEATQMRLENTHWIYRAEAGTGEDIFFVKV